MIFGFGKKNQQQDDFDEEVELVLFQGTFSGVVVDLSEHARLVEAGMLRAKELVTEALERRAELLRLEPKGDRVVAQMMVDGIGHAGARLSAKEGLAVSQCLKLVAGIDPKERKKPQRGGIKAEFADRKYLLMVETKPLEGGVERINVHLIDIKEAKYSAQELGFNETVGKKIREMASERGGIILAAGPPGSGTTTTAFAIVRGIDSYLYAVFSLVDVGHRDLKNVSKFDRRENESLDDALQRLIRQEGDVAYIDPITSPEIAKIALNKQESLTLISEMTARDAASAIENFSKMTGDPAATAQAIKGVISQKLIRRLCYKCKQPYRPNPKLVQKVGLPETVQTLYRPYKPEEGEDVRICKVCGGVGYLGRIAMLEMIEMTDGIRELVAAGKSAAEIKAQARKENMLTFKDDGMRLVAEGITSLDELQRVFKA
ncbi:MAG: Flp pilus assembly complex ATPase component TadA [Planctomycetaceae bacterium]|nr:Flp pilus assembly complex ATPase component TadA [Planctomycetaceae bacterium]